MASTAVLIPATPAQGRKPGGFGPAEGWSVLLPHAAALALTAFSITKIEARDRADVLIPIILSGLLFGLILAKLPMLDSFAHLAAIITGGFVVLGLVATREVGFRATFHERGRPVYQLGRDIVDRFARGSGTKLPDIEVLTLVALTLWMVGYSSAWMLYRRQWLIPSLVLPGTMLMVTMRYDDQPPTFPVMGFLFCAILMSARHYAFRESRNWGRRRLSAPAGVPTKLAVGGAAIALLALALGWGVTYSSSETLRTEATEQGAQAWTKIQEMWSKTGLPGSGQGGAAGSYSTFPNSFDMGGDLDLSDAVVADVSSRVGHYLAVRSYDYYNGKGWETTVDDTFKMPGDKTNVHAIPIGFEPGQAVPFSQDLVSGLVGSQASIHVYSNKDGLVFTIESFDSSTIHTVALMGWVKFDHVEYDIATIDPATLPPDLQGLVSSLKQAKFALGPSGGEPIIIQNSTSSTVSAERQRLMGFPLTTSLALNRDGDPVLTVNGRLPNYDDIEAVYKTIESNNVSNYQVAGVESAATKEQLEAAGTDYPAWVTQRYLQQSSTVTDRTKVLAQSVVSQAGADNPFAEAWALQEYLTGPDFTYELNSPGARDGQDFVDHFLFDSKVGRCEQFATSMVVMLRELGVPSRLVSGYRLGEKDANGRWVYRENQAHTWVEVYFPGSGWIPFEPTKGQDPFQYGKAKTPAEAQTPTPEAVEATPVSTPAPEPTETPVPTATPVAPLNNTDQSSGGGHWWDNLSAGTLALLAIVAGLGAAIGGGFLMWIWGLRGMSPAASLYARVLRLGKFLGVQPDPTMTPSEFANEFSATVPAAGPAVRVVTDLYLAERYGHARVDEREAAKGRGAWRQMRRHFLVWRSRRGRRRRRGNGANE